MKVTVYERQKPSKKVAQHDVEKIIQDGKKVFLITKSVSVEYDLHFVKITSWIY